MDGTAAMTAPWPTACHLLAARARETPAADLLRFASSTLTVGELHAASGRLGAALLRHGLAPGDAVALLLPSGPEFPVAWFGALRAGVVAVPVDPRARAADLGHVLGDAGVRAVLTTATALPLVRQVAATLPALRWIGTFGPGGDLDVGAALRGEPREAALEALDPHAVASVQYTSGTTGFPKGCVLGHDYWLHFGASTLALVGLRADDVALTAQPFHYVDPTWNLLMALMAGAPLVVLPRFSASTFWRRVGEAGATYFYCLGTMPLYLRQQPADAAADRGHRVRLVYCSGIDPAAHADFEARWGAPWREAYGSTELGAVLGVPADDAGSVGSGCLGVPAVGREVRIVDAAGRDADPGEAGELLVRGPACMRGYLNQPDATRAWRGDDGWARTGDLVTRSPAGCIRLVGRLKEMIRRGGENIAAAEVEAALLRDPRVRLAACVPEPDPLRGQEVKAFVQLAPGTPASRATAESLVRHVRDDLAAFKAPRYVVFAEAMPLTPSERVAKPELAREAARHGWPVHDIPPSAGDPR